MDWGSNILHALQILLFAMCMWAVFKGRAPERLGAILVLCDVLVRIGLGALGYPLDFESPRSVYLISAGLFFLASLALVLKSNRVWPMFYSAFCLIQFAGHFSVILLQSGDKRAYWAITQVPLAVQTLVLAMGTLACILRYKRGIHANDWH